LFFFAVSAPSSISALSLHDALPIFAMGDFARERRRMPIPSEVKVRDARRNRIGPARQSRPVDIFGGIRRSFHQEFPRNTVDRNQDRKSTRLNSSHVSISYAVFCLKK